MASSDPPWSDLPHHILGLVIDHLDSSLAPAAAAARRPFWSACFQLLREFLQDDRARSRARSWARFRALCRSHYTEAAVNRARFQAVCRSWRAAVREHLPPPPRSLPWTLLPYDGTFTTGSDTSCHPLPYWPPNATLIGSTDDWLTFECADDVRETRSYLLHNLFSGATVRLPELDALIGASSCSFKVRKVLMRSTPTEVVAFLTNNYNYPIIIVLPGKGVWLPRPRSAPFIYIFDIAFVGDKLYGITLAEDLISLDIAFDADNKPTVTRTKRVIRHATKSGDRSNVWGNVDFTRVVTYLSPLDDGYDLWSDVDEKYRENDVKAKEEDDDDDETLREEEEEEDDDDRAWYEIRKNTGDGTILQDFDFDGCNDLLSTTWYIVESLGKLLMVRQKKIGIDFSCSADVFEANMDARNSWA